MYGFSKLLTIYETRLQPICSDDNKQNKELNNVLGSARVGKTCLVARFLGGKFQDSYTPTIEDFHRKLYRIRGEIYQLDILDTSGNHPFPAMRRLSFLTGELLFYVNCLLSVIGIIFLFETNYINSFFLFTSELSIKKKQNSDL